MVVLKALFSSKSDRLFYICGDIKARNCADISLINLEDDRDDEIEKSFVRKPIRIYINSFGESVYDMWLLVDTILKSETPVYTYCNSCAMSVDFQIFWAGHKRYISPHATLMYHQIYCWKSGKYQDLVEDRQHMEHLNSQIEEYVIQRTNLTQDYLNSIREKRKRIFILQLLTQWN